MIELTPDNAVHYLRQRGWVGADPVQVEPFGWGVSNVVLRVVTPERSFVLKQSCSRLRTRDPWFSDLERVYREQEVMQLLSQVLPPPTVPEVLFTDRDNFVFAMSEAPATSRVWKETLLRGEVDQQVASHAGQILARIHETTARNAALVDRFGDHTVFVQLRVEPFYRRIQEVRPEFAGAIEPIVERMLSVKVALCHGDYSPKNILVHDQGFTLVDYETAHFGDPTMDLGFFLSHLMLKAIKNSAIREQYYDLTRSFWSSYRRAAQFRPFDELVRHGIEHFAVCALARIDGTSPVDYLPEESKRETVLKMVRRILTEKPAQWPLVLEITDECLNS
jgi:5-methylthioribose kinase